MGLEFFLCSGNYSGDAHVTGDGYGQWAMSRTASIPASKSADALNRERRRQRWATIWKYDAVPLREPPAVPIDAVSLIRMPTCAPV